MAAPIDLCSHRNYVTGTAFMLTSRLRTLRALTSLRFIAAGMIVLHHSRGLFGINVDIWQTLAQGVSFFFVLSGFILAYVYPSFSSSRSMARFFVARFARIWPAHIVAVVLLVAIVPAALWKPTTEGWITILASNLFMLHGWIPLREYFYSLNSPSWSISTEMFFYLAFPTLIFFLRRGLLAVLIFAFFLAAGSIVLSYALQLPVGVIESHGVSALALVYILPIARLFEFVLGMVIAMLWREKHFSKNLSALGSSALELSVVAITIASLWFCNRWGQQLEHANADALTVWITYSGSCAAFGALILVMAAERGWVSRALSLRTFVLLGEISYSIYLVHFPLLRYYQWHQHAFANVPGWVAYGLFLGVLLLLAYCLWYVVELPARRFLVDWWVARTERRRSETRTILVGASAVQSAASRQHSTAIAALAVLITLITVIYFLRQPTSVQLIDRAVAEQIAKSGHAGARDVRFNDRFILRGAKLRQHGDGLTLQLAWESLADQPLRYVNAIHLVDVDGTILAQADYPQDPNAGKVKATDIWLDNINISQRQLAGAIAVAIAIYSTDVMLLADRGERDWGGRRLLVPLPSWHRSN